MLSLLAPPRSEGFVSPQPRVSQVASVEPRT